MLARLITTGFVKIAVAGCRPLGQLAAFIQQRVRHGLSTAADRPVAVQQGEAPRLAATHCQWSRGLACGDARQRQTRPTKQGLRAARPSFVGRQAIPAPPRPASRVGMARRPPRRTPRTASDNARRRLRCRRLCRRGLALRPCTHSILDKSGVHHEPQPLHANTTCAGFDCAAWRIVP
jgi:hypothetical protein